MGDKKLSKDGFVFKKDRFVSPKPRGCWYNKETNERLFPDLEAENQEDCHWDYYGPKFPYGARLYIDGTWSAK